jgi:pyrrolysyl-tRNA synthetase-like protein
MEKMIMEASKQKVVRYIFKNQRLFLLIDKVKLWPSRSGTLHGVKSLESTGKTMVVTTHCGESFVVWDSKNSRSARWLRNRWCKNPCEKCKIPGWKLIKYSQTIFSDIKR